jgi:hypothetical protein
MRRAASASTTQDASHGSSRRTQRQFVKAVLLVFHGISDFDGLRSGKYNEEVRLYAFDILALDGDDLRKLPLSARKRHLGRLLKRRPNGIFLAPFEQGEIGPDRVQLGGLEGIVSRPADRPYRADPSKDWGECRISSIRSTVPVEPGACFFGREKFRDEAPAQVFRSTCQNFD